MSKINGVRDIVKVAIYLFEKKGYNGTSMRDISKELNIKVSSLYSHITSKNQILEMICADVANKFMKCVMEIEMKNLPPKRKLKLFFIAHVRLILANSSAMTVYGKEWKFISKKEVAAISKMRHIYENRIKMIIDVGIAQGEFIKMDSSFAAFFLLASLNNFEYWKKYKHALPDIANVLIKGISK